MLAIRDRVLQQSKPWKNEEEKKKTLKIFDEFIQEFFTLNTIAYDENLYQQILWVCILTYGGFELFPNKYKIVFNRVDHFTDQFKNSRLQSYQEFHHLFDKTNQALNPSRDYLGDQLLFLIGILSPEFYSNKVQAKVKFYSDLGFEHQKFYKSIFESYFSDILVLEVESDAAADFIISNYYFDNSKKPVLFIKDYPSKQDLLEIHEHMLAKMTLLINPRDSGIKGKLALDA